MKYKILLIEHNAVSLRIIKRVIGKANLDVVVASTLTEAKVIFDQSTPESFLCAVVDYTLPDAPHGEAIDFAISSFVPVIVLTDQPDSDVRARILSKAVVDYIPKQNHQVFEYLSRLLTRLEKNRHVGVLVMAKTPSKRNPVCELLNRHNFVTYQANNLEQAKVLLLKHPSIKQLIVDNKLRDQSGIELVANLRKEYSKEELSIIGTSEQDDPALLARFIKSGANDYLRIPYCHEEFFCRVLQNIEYIEQIDIIRKTANTDYLTGLPNRRHFFSEVKTILRREPENVSLALLDLDHFKAINDTYGHEQGDIVLKDVAKLMKKHFKSHPISRFGGEEFCVFFDGINQVNALKKLEDFRLAVQEKMFKSGKRKVKCTVSIGLTSKGHQKIEQMLSFADENLYKAKSNGRNRIVSDQILNTASL
ncbi:GGDEF domain-containing response regulator [Glaciecola sp. 1036]|uniref:GGDEF domain-containing response regulator n=1 Tax=Alteromonadaceae TaxID=72275 RepID=UPI003D01EF15